MELYQLLLLVQDDGSAHSLSLLLLHFVDVFLPYPVQVNSAQVTLNRTQNSLDLKLGIDKTWGTEDADCGSAPWLLAQALRGNDDEATETTMDSYRQPKPKSLAEMFHLDQPDAREVPHTSTMADQAAKWDPVDEDEELPEDRFHRKDMMSMHILEQRKAERDQKAKEAEAKRKLQRSEVEEKQRKAKEAGKSWREMYPNDPETTYIDMEDILEQQKAKQTQNDNDGARKDIESLQFIPTEDAIKAAAAWSENSKDVDLDLSSALAFELLD